MTRTSYILMRWWCY